MFLSLLILAAPPEPAFVVKPADATTKASFVVQPAAPTPAPKTVRWQWWDAFGNTWFTDEPAAPRVMPPAAGVPAAAPFAGPVAGSTPTTAATPAATSPRPAPAPGSFGATTPTARTLMRAPFAGTFGGTSGCTSFG